MGIYQIASFTVIAAVLSLSIKKDAPVFSLLLTLAASLVILFVVMPRLGVVLDLLSEIDKGIDSSIPFMETIFKILGISYISEFAAQAVTDAGEGALASKMELAGKVLILVAAAPIVLALVKQLGYLMS